MYERMNIGVVKIAPISAPVRRVKKPAGLGAHDRRNWRDHGSVSRPYIKQLEPGPSDRIGVVIPGIQDPNGNGLIPDEKTKGTVRAACNARGWKTKTARQKDGSYILWRLE